RKKAGDNPSKETAKAPEPLQPRFYDNDPTSAPASVPVEADGVERDAELQPAPEPAAAKMITSAEGAIKSLAPRRRRSRGRRGGSRQRTVATAPAGAAEPAAE